MHNSEGTPPAIETKRQAFTNKQTSSLQAFLWRLEFRVSNTPSVSVFPIYPLSYFPIYSLYRVSNMPTDAFETRNPRRYRNACSLLACLFGNACSLLCTLVTYGWGTPLHDPPACTTGRAALIAPYCALLRLIAPYCSLLRLIAADVLLHLSVGSPYCALLCVIAH